MIPSYINSNKSTSLDAVLYFFCHTYTFFCTPTLAHTERENWPIQIHCIDVCVCMYVCVLGLILAGNTIPRENFEVYHLPCFSDLLDEWQLSGPMAELTGHSQLITNIPPFEGKWLKHSLFLSLYFWFFFFKVCLAPNGEQTEVGEQEVEWRQDCVPLLVFDML